MKNNSSHKSKWAQNIIEENRGKMTFCNVCKKDFKLPEESIRGPICCEYCNSPYWHLPQAPSVAAEIRAIEDKSKLSYPENEKDYKRFCEAMDDIDKRYGFIK